MQATGPDSIGAPLVFLNLLKGQADRFTELFLAQTEHVAAQSHSRADMDIDRVRLVALSATRPPGLLLHRHLLSIALTQGGVTEVIAYTIVRDEQPNRYKRNRSVSGLVPTTRGERRTA